jgi:hypothetical protein
MDWTLFWLKFWEDVFRDMRTRRVGNVIFVTKWRKK